MTAVGEEAEDGAVLVVPEIAGESFKSLDSRYQGIHLDFTSASHRSHSYKRLGFCSRSLHLCIDFRDQAQFAKLISVWK